MRTPSKRRMCLGKFMPRRPRQALVRVLADTDRVLTPEQMAAEFLAATRPAPPSVPLTGLIDESQLF